MWPTAPDVYAILHCENDTIRTRVFNAEGNPEFNLRAIFYRRYPDTHISVEVWLIPITSITYITYVDSRYAHTVSVCVLLCAGMEQRSAVGLGARRGSTPDGRVREESEPRDWSARRPIPFRMPTVRLRRDVLQHLSHRLVTRHATATAVLSGGRWWANKFDELRNKLVLDSSKN